MSSSGSYSFDCRLFRHAYRRIRKTLKASNLDPEPFRACLAAELHRQYWKPAQPRLILLAESHVYTDENDLEFTVNHPSLAHSVPSQFVRLIYCLGYGGQLHEGTPAFRNTGTPQYWELFGFCAGTAGHSQQDFQWKLDTLQRLRSRGIWLLDASIHACMNPRFPQGDHRRRMSGRLYKDVLAASWEYVRTNVLSCDEVWCIGKNLRNDLDAPILDRGKWIYQPNGARNVAQRSEDAMQRSLLQQAISRVCAG
jgi:hypothetical protein